MSRRRITKQVEMKENTATVRDGDGITHDCKGGEATEAFTRL